MERDPRRTGKYAESWNFNSHAHVERDRCVADKHPIIKISTHTLTWSVTWSENSAVKFSYFNSHAHVERDYANR